MFETLLLLLLTPTTGPVNVPAAPDASQPVRLAKPTILKDETNLFPPAADKARNAWQRAVRLHDDAEQKRVSDGEPRSIRKAYLRALDGWDLAVRRAGQAGIGERASAAAARYRCDALVWLARYAEAMDQCAAAVAARPEVPTVKALELRALLGAGHLNAVPAAFDRLLADAQLYPDAWVHVDAALADFERMAGALRTAPASARTDAQNAFLDWLDVIRRDVADTIRWNEPTPSEN